MKRVVINSIGLIMIFYLAACSGTKNLPKGERLYTGSDIKFEYKGKIKNKRVLKAAAESAVRPRPN